MYVVVISLNGKTQYHQHEDYEAALIRWAHATKDVREAMKIMGKDLTQLFNAKVYMTRLEDNKRKIILAFDNKGTIAFL
jgi:hypothetical protein